MKKISSGLLAFLGTLSLPWMLNLRGDIHNPVMGHSLTISNSWFGVFVWAVCFFLTCRALENGAWSRKKEAEKTTVTGKTAAAGKTATEKSAVTGKITAAILALGFSVSLAFGVQLERAESVNFGDGMMWLAIGTWTVLFAIWIYAGWELLDRKTQKKAVKEHGNGGKPTPLWLKRWQKMINGWDALTGKRQTLLVFCIFLLSWLPVFLAVYPGFFVYDAQDELIQVQTRQFTTHHPLPHVLLLGGIIQAVHKLTGSYNAGIAAYTLFQMVLLSGVFTYVIYYMKKRGIGRTLRILSVVYFAFFPVIVMFSLCSAKDGIFSAALLLLLLSLADMGREKEAFFRNRGKLLLFVGSAFVMMSFRHNGMYAFLVLVPVLLFMMKGLRKKTGLLLGITFGLYFLVSAGLTAVFSAETSENQEMLTVPIQQLARTYKYDKESLTEEQLETLYEILPEEVLRFYTPKVSDGVKIHFNNGAYRKNPGKYAKLWLEVGAAHPFTYLNAWFMTSYGFWYPDTVIDVYRGNSVFTFTYEDSTFFGYEVEQPGVRESKIPWLDECYRRMSLEIAQQRIPVVSMLFSMGFLFWLWAFAGGYVIYRRDYDLLPPFILLLLIWLTVILGPTYLPRYVLIFWFALPGAVAVLVNRR